MKLNVGCGRNVLPGWVNLDSYAGPEVDMVVDLENCARGPVMRRYIDLDDDSVDEFMLSHVIEHIRNVLPMMQELYRIAKPGAAMTVFCPHGASDDADEDPTHVRRMFPGSFGYFGQPYYWRADYGYRGDWQVTRMLLKSYGTHVSTSDLLLRRNVIAEMVATLIAIKPMREPRRELQVHVPPSIAY